MTISTPLATRTSATAVTVMFAVNGLLLGGYGGSLPSLREKIGIDATVKSRHDPADFERAWPRNWGKVKLEDYL